MSSLQTTIPRKLEYLQKLSKEEQAIGAAVVLAIVAAAVYTSQPVKKNTAPFVPGNTLVGNTSYEADPRGWTEHFAELHGGTFRTDVFGRTGTVVGKRLAREVMISDNFSLTKAVEDFLDVAKMFGIKDTYRYLNGMSIITKHLTPNLKNYTTRVNEQLTIVANRWLGDLEEPKSIPHLFPFVGAMVSKASVSVFLGEELCKNDSIVTSLGSVTMDIGSNLRQNWLMKTFPTMNTWYQRYIFPHKKMVQHHRLNAKTHIAPEIKRRLRESKNPDYKRPDDMLQHLMDTYPADGDYGVSYEDYLTNWTFMLVFASIHTTTENTTMVLYWLMKYPQYTQELLEEQKEVIESEGTKGQDVELTFDVVKKLVKLDSFVREVFRQRTVGLVLQHKNISKDDIELSNGTVVPSGENVFINSWEISRSPDLQGDDAEDFRPWRFVESRKQAVRIGEDHITFGIGKHACPGRFFAVQEIKTIVSMLISRYKLSPEGDVILPMSLRAMPVGSIKFEKRSN